MRHLFLSLILLFGTIPLKAQYDSDLFKARISAAVASSDMEMIVDSDTLLPYQIGEICSVWISGEAHLQNKSTSLIRVTLQDLEGREYLMYETYPLLADSLVHLIDNIGIETVELPCGISPQYIKVKVRDASIKISSINSVSGSRQEKNFMQRSRSVQNAYIVDKLNDHLRERGIPWRAGLNSIGSLTYEEKKSIMGENLLDLGGFEYYKGGIFVVQNSGEKENVAIPLSTDSDLYVKEFDWRNRHGKNWISPAKKQDGYTCWAFGAVSLVESYINCYYNRILNYDLSEMDLMLNAEDYIIERGGYVEKALIYIRDTGIVGEDCCPFVYPIDNAYKCPEPTEIVKIEDYRRDIHLNFDDLKRYVIKYPVCVDFFRKVDGGGHSVLLTGFKDLQVGDSIIIDCYQILGKEEKEYIGEGSSLAGRTAWLIKNSFGRDWGTDGFCYIVDDNFLRNRTNINYIDCKRVGSNILSDKDIRVVDKDGDGYYTWGFGARPNNLPEWVPLEQDGDDSNPHLGPMDAYGHLSNITSIYEEELIDTPTVWESDAFISHQIRIISGGSLTVKGHVYLHSKVAVEVDGGQLIIDGGTLEGAEITAYRGSEVVLKNGGKLCFLSEDNFHVKEGAVLEIINGGITVKNKRNE